MKFKITYITCIIIIYFLLLNGASAMEPEAGGSNIPAIPTTNAIEYSSKEFDKAMNDERAERHEAEKQMSRVPSRNLPSTSSPTLSPRISGGILPNFNESEFSKNRRKIAKLMVERASNYIKNNPEDKAFSALTHDRKFSDGEVYPFVLTTDGTVLAHGEDEYLVWQNLYNYQDNIGTFVVREILDKAKQGGGWLTYNWRNATKVSYIQEVVKGNQRYIVGAGFYPHSKQDNVVSLVKSAVEYYNRRIKSGENGEAAFSEFSYPLGNFIYGDLYLYALRFDGKIVAQGDRPGLIGQNSWNYKDSNGKFVNQEIVSKLKNSRNGVWVEYESKRAHKIAYAEKVVDNKGVEYFIACGYYPDANRNQTVELVRLGNRYMELHGLSQAVAAFTNRSSDAFRFGDLYLVIYDLKGKCLAHGANPDYVGTNQWTVQDDDGDYITQGIIERAQKGGGWADFRLRNAFYFVYTELVTLGTDNYVLACGIYPSSKPETMQLLVKDAVSMLDDHTRIQVFAEIGKKNGHLINGDLEIFVFDQNGICYAYGSNYDLIWRNMVNASDDNGKKYVQSIINVGKKGEGKVMYKMNGKMKIAYVEPYEKDGISYVIGSSFYL